jgi:hypothetical protein
MWLRWSAPHNTLISCKNDSADLTRVTVLGRLKYTQQCTWLTVCSLDTDIVVKRPNHNALETVIIILKLHVSFLHENRRALLQQERSPDRCSEVKHSEGFITETRTNAFIYNKINEMFLPLHYLGFFVNITLLVQKNLLWNFIIVIN